MEETPTDASQEGVQVRTADDRVATVLLKRPGGWYDIKVRRGAERPNEFLRVGRPGPAPVAGISADRRQYHFLYRNKYVGRKEKRLKSTL